VDLRTLRPLDVEAILRSIHKTNRAVYVEEGWAFGGIGAQIVSLIQEEAFDYLDAPVIRVTQADVPMPYAKQLEKFAKPSVERIIDACNRVLYRTQEA
jgi:pyruvate dehydrogenase E1 component beta subunit